MAPLLLLLPATLQVPCTTMPRYTMHAWTNTYSQTPILTKPKQGWQVFGQLVTKTLWLTTTLNFLMRFFFLAMSRNEQVATHGYNEHFFF